MRNNKSIVLSICLVKAVYAAIALCCVAAPFMVRYYDNAIVIPESGKSIFAPLLITLYSIVPPALAAMICLDLLLGNIRKGQPFIEKNVKYLRVISYCAFAVAALFVYFATLRPFAFAIVFAAAFIGLILRVVKNCFEQAVAIREENDFTV
jgi:hypothetical protein